MKKRLVLILILSALLVGCNSERIDNSEKEIVESKSESIPKLDDLLSYFNRESNDISIIYEEDTIKVYSMKIDKTYDEVDEILTNYDDFVFKEYNTSLSGSYNMDESGNVGYRTWIIGNSDFEMTISYINEKKKFLSNYDDEFYKKIENHNIVIVIDEK